MFIVIQITSLYYISFFQLFLFLSKRDEMHLIVILAFIPFIPIPMHLA